MSCWVCSSTTHLNAVKWFYWTIYVSCLSSTCPSSLRVHIWIICFHEGLYSVQQIFLKVGRLANRQQDHALGPVAVKWTKEWSLDTEPDSQVHKPAAGWSYLSATGWKQKEQIPPLQTPCDHRATRTQKHLHDLQISPCCTDILPFLSCFLNESRSNNI